jgi:hypothetical protein
MKTKCKYGKKIGAIFAIENLKIHFIFTFCILYFTNEEG